MPFAWQHEQTLLLLDDDPAGWMMAELKFDRVQCRYVELRRVTYRWAREAIGGILSRALVCGDHASVDAAFALHRWLFTYYGIPVVTEQLSTPDRSSFDIVFEN